MKKLIKQSVVVLGLFTTTLMFANENIRTIKEKEPIVTSISFKKVKPGSKLSIKDGEGSVLYRESIVKKGDYTKGFDLTTLPNGDYYFELDTAFEIVVIPFNVVSNQVVFKKDEKSTILKPQVRVKEELVYVSHVSFDESPLEYKIFYAANDDLVLSEKLDEAGDKKKVYDFSTAQKGNYVFVFKSNGRRFTQKIKI